MALSYKTIKPLLLTGNSKNSSWLSYAGLGIGVLLLLCSVQMFVNLQQLVTKTSIRKNGFDFISVTKLITNENMGKDNRFSKEDIAALKSKSFIADAAPLIPNLFRVKASAGSTIAFSTDLFIEALNNNFIDTVPPSFVWQPGDASVPMILSTEFLEMFNVFAPSYGLPQFSQQTVSNITVMLHCEGRLNSQVFNAHIVAFSDRVNSILAPESFLQWANENLHGDTDVKASRVFIKTADANNMDLLKFLTEENYRVNKERTILGRSKQVLQGVVSGLAIFGILVVALSLMLFSFYLQLVVAKSKDNLQLLLTLGYSPGWLSKNVARQFIPIYIIVVLTALCITQLMQWAFHQKTMYNRPELSSFLHWIVLAAGGLLILLSIISNYRLVRRLLFRII